MTLPAELHEVSGLAVTADGRLFAQGDERGAVFEVEPRSGRVLRSFSLAPTGAEPDLGKRAKDGEVTGDFEDIAVVGERFFLVTSNGVLVEFREGAEGERVAVYRWSLAERRLGDTPRLVVPYAALARLTGERGFNGSALDFTPGGGSLVLVAGPQRLFAEVAPDGRPIRGGALDRATHPQPEGIAFLPDGTLLVSSEGGKGEATLSGYLPK